MIKYGNITVKKVEITMPGNELMWGVDIFVEDIYRDTLLNAKETDKEKILKIINKS